MVIATHDNLPVLRRCLESWERFAASQPVELLVIEDGCSDGTAEYLAERAGTEWGRRVLRPLHEENVHELMCTNRGLAEARAPLVMSWHDDMFLRASWFVPELIATFRAYPEIGLLALSRGLVCTPHDEPVRTWEDSIDWRRLRSTIGPAPLNWLRLHEVDAVVRPWVVRAECVRAVGALDEAFRPTEWDEADLAFRIRAAGWKVATHGYERGGAYEHLLSSTLSRTPSEARMALGLRNALLFHRRWDDDIRREHARPRRAWTRRATPAGWAATLAAMARATLSRGGAS